MIKEDIFIEYKMVHGEYCGTLKSKYEEQLKVG